MTQYFYEGGRLLFPPLVLVWFIFLFVAWGPRRMRPHLTGMAMALVAALLVALPMYVTMAATNAPFSSRLNDSGVEASLFGQFRDYASLDPSAQTTLVGRIVNPFLAYTALPDTSGIWYGQDQPMVPPVLVPLFLLGAGFSLWRLRSPGSVVLLAILAASAGNTLVQESLWYARYVMAMPFLPVLMAIGLRCVVPMLWPRARLPESLGWRKAGAAVVPGLAALAMVGQAVYFFGPFQQAYAVSWRASDSRPDSNDAVLRASELPDIARMQVVLIGRNLPEEHVPRGLFGFLVPDALYPLAVQTSADVSPDYLAKLPRDRGYVFFVEGADTETMRRLAEAFLLGSPRYSTRSMLPAWDELLMFVVPPPPDAPTK
jgi:hypothetical protein